MSSNKYPVFDFGITHPGNSSEAPQLIKKFLAFYKNLNFLTVFTTPVPIMSQINPQRIKKSTKDLLR